MNRPRSTKRLLTDILKDGHLTRAALADVLDISTHRLNRIQMGSVRGTDLEQTSILAYHEDTFLEPPDAGDDNDIPEAPAPREGSTTCPTPTPDSSSSQEPPNSQTGSSTSTPTSDA